MNLLTGLAGYLADRVQALDWSPVSAYPDDAYGLYLLALPASGLGVALAPYGGADSSPRLGYDMPDVQARVRGTSSPLDAQSVAQGIYGALHGLTETEMPNGVYVITAACLGSGPVYIGKDAQGRHEFTVNIRFTVRNATANREAPI